MLLHTFLSRLHSSDSFSGQLASLVNGTDRSPYGGADHQHTSPSSRPCGAPVAQMSREHKHLEEASSMK